MSGTNRPLRGAFSLLALSLFLGLPAFAQVARRGPPVVPQGTSFSGLGSAASATRLTSQTMPVQPAVLGPSVVTLSAASAEAPVAVLPLEAPAAAPSSEESESLWTGGMPASEARKRLDRARWETTKFFFGSRVRLLREMIKTQEAESEGKLRAVEDLEGMWLDWRVKSYTGGVATTGFKVSDRATTRKDALNIFDRYFPKDESARQAYRRYMDRVGVVVPLERPSNYRKNAYRVFYELPIVDPQEVPARIDAMLSEAHIAGFQAHRAERQPAILASFQEAALASIRDVNAGLPAGRKIVAVILLGSYAIGQSTPDSDIDYQLVTQDGGFAAIAPFKDALAKHWTRHTLEKIEAFQFTLPPSREVVEESFVEGYRVISPDPQVVKILSKDSFSPPEASRWLRLRGRIFAAFYRAWCWSYLRLADFAERLAMSARKS